MTDDTQPIYHKNIAGGPSVKGVTCKFCGAYVGLVQSKKSGKWYTCELQASMNPDSAARNAYPFMPHFPRCRVNLRVREIKMQMFELDPDFDDDYSIDAAIRRQAEHDTKETGQ